MRARVFFLLLASVIPAFAAKPVTVAQLEQMASELRGKSDLESARRLSDVHLTERLSARRLEKLQAVTPGEKSRNALLSLADESAFLTLPTSDIVPNPAPAALDQRRIMALVVSYVTRTIPKLPDFLATRTTSRFEDQPARSVELSRNPGDFVSRYQPLHSAGSSVQEVSYRSGREEIDNGKGAGAGERGLRTWGEFGPILSTILLDASQSRLEWLHWELAEPKHLAVFKYVVPKEKSHFEINYCCVADSEGRTKGFRELVGYSGEMAVDPTTGTILRLQLSADLKPGNPVTRAGLVVEYGNIEIGGKVYICPIHSIALSRGQSLAKEKQEMVQTAAHGQVGFGLATVVVGTTPDVVEQTLINDSVYAQYHVFRSEMRVIAGTPPHQATDGSEAPPAPPQTAGAPTTPTATDKEVARLETAPAPETSSSGPSTAIPDAAVPPALAKTEAPVVPEISSSTTTSIPDVPVQQQTIPSPSGFILRTTSRLVDVSVVAFDKKGRPVTDLKADDFELYDNGRKETVSVFSHAGTAPPVVESSPTPPQVAPEAEQPEFSNQRSAQAEAAHEASATILMIDASNLAFNDLTHARNEMLQFLKTIPANEHVGLYILRKHGFEILREPTTDHNDLAMTLSRWMPNAQDLAQAQHEDERTHQQLEYVHNVTDLLHVNGNLSSGEGDLYAPVDPQLRSLGDNPPRDALAFLTWVARHLAAIPGHKSLIWISSDNVLADFTDRGPSLEKGDNLNDQLAIRAREALNEAHTSIYPLNASQLEAGGVGANLQHGNVQSSPAANEQAQLAQLPPGLREDAKEALEKSQRDINPGRVTAQMQQDTHAIQGTFRELAEATGGRPLRRAGDIAAELNTIVADGRAAYMLSFTPDAAPDDTYHHITVKIAHRNDITLRYRSGYLFLKEATTMKERVRQAVWQPSDVTEIALNVGPSQAKAGMLRLTIAATDLALAQQGEFWTDKLDIFQIERDDAALHAKITGKTLALHLTPATYQRVLKKGIDIDQPIQTAPESGALRILVVDENSGRMGTLTIPGSVARKK